MPSKQISYSDQLGRQVTIPANPQRIISLVPSQTELLFELGLGEKIVGITKFCIHPAACVAAKPKIGGTRQLDIEKIKSLQPDLIIANKEENDRNQIQELMQHFPVWVSDINNLDDALPMIEVVGDITGKLPLGKQLTSYISECFRQLIPLVNPKSVAYFIWRKPYMVAGNETYIDDMLSRCGLVNCVKEARYPELNIQALVELSLQVVLLSSEPYPFKQKHIDEFRAMLPNAHVFLVDGEMFSWYGSRPQFAAKYFAQIIKMLENQS